MSALATIATSLLGDLKDIGMSVGQGFINEYFYNRANKHLTGREREQNQFNAEQAQINRDFEERMSNTANQRAVADMQAAGLNPALMMGNGSAASTPTGSNAQGSTSNAQLFDFASAIQAMTQKRLADSEIKLKDSEVRLNDAKARESTVSADKIVEETLNIKETRKEIVSRVEGLGLDNEQKKVILKYADESEQAKLDNLKKDLDVKEESIKKFRAEVDKLSEEKKKIVQETLNLQEQVNLMLTQENLNQAQAAQCAHMIGQIDANTAILQKDASHYDWNHMKQFSVKDGFIVSTDQGTLSGGFAGLEAASTNPQKKAERKRNRAIKKSQQYAKRDNRW